MKNTEQGVGMKQLNIFSLVIITIFITGCGAGTRQAVGVTGSGYGTNSINNPYGQYGSKYSNKSVNNPYATNAPKIYDSQGNYRGRLSSNKYDPDSTSNPYGRYGSKYSADSINNPYGAGSKYRVDSPNNPYGSGMSLYGQ